MNFFNYYGLELYLQNNMPVQKISSTFSDKSSVLHYSVIRNKKLMLGKLISETARVRVVSYPCGFAFHLN